MSIAGVLVNEESITFPQHLPIRTGAGALSLLYLLQVDSLTTRSVPPVSGRTAVTRQGEGPMQSSASQPRWKQGPQTETGAPHFVFLLLEGEASRTGSPIPSPDLAGCFLCPQDPLASPRSADWRQTPWPCLGLTTAFTECQARPGGLPAHTVLDNQRTVSHKATQSSFIHAIYVPGGDSFVCPRGPCSGPTTRSSPTPPVLTSNFSSGCGQQPTVTMTTRNLILSTQDAAGLSQRRLPSSPIFLAPLRLGSCLPAFPPQAAWPVLSKPALNTSAWSPGRPRGWPRALRPQLRPPRLGSDSRKPATGPRSRPECVFAQALTKAEQSLLLNVGPMSSPFASKKQRKKYKPSWSAEALSMGPVAARGSPLSPGTGPGVTALS